MAEGKWTACELLLWINHHKTCPQSFSCVSIHTETVTEPTPTPTEETPREEPAPKEAEKKEETKPEEATEEKKSFFTVLCSCLGGSAPAPDTDVKAKDKEVVTKEDEKDDEKEETEEKPEQPATTPVDAEA